MNERKTALQILMRVFQEKAYISLLLRQLKEEQGTAFISELVYGTVRNIDLLDYQWKHFARRKTNLHTRLLLDMTCYQMFFMDSVPAYAAVNEAVSLSLKNEKGFVNAVLHKVEKQGLVHNTDLSIETSHPAWLLNMWKSHYGETTMEKMARADQNRGIVYGRINPLRISKAQMEQNPDVHFVNALSFTYNGNLVQSEWFEKGEVLIQDVHSAEAVRDMDLKPGMQVLDLCGAPGTKTQEMAAMMHDEGKIIACDLYPNRLSLIDALMLKTGVHIVETKVNDAEKPHAFERESFDRILCDVPCSGLGDLRHKPEIRLHVTPEKIDEIVQVQARILENAAEYLKKGGLLVYSTCTLNKKENERQVQHFLTNHPDFSLLKEGTRFPYEDEGDGFYHALLRKNGL